MAYHALIIGIGSYSDSRLQDLKAARDAQAVASVLTDRWPSGSTVKTLVDQAATKSAISDQLDQLARVTRPDDTVIVFFSGHGVQYVGGFAPGEYLCTAGARLDRSPEALVSSRELSDSLAAIKANHLIVFLDACHSGGLSTAKDSLAHPPRKMGLTATSYDLLSRAPGRALLAACGPDESAWEFGNDPNGVFTKHLVNELRADDEDGVRFSRVLSNVMDAVVRESAAHGHLQTPYSQFKGSDIVLIPGKVQASQGLSDPAPDEPGDWWRRHAKTITRTLQSIAAALAVGALIYLMSQWRTASEVSPPPTEVVRSLTPSTSPSPQVTRAAVYKIVVAEADPETGHDLGAISVVRHALDTYQTSQFIAVEVVSEPAPDSQSLALIAKELGASLGIWINENAENIEVEFLRIVEPSTTSERFISDDVVDWRESLPISVTLVSSMGIADFLQSIAGPEDPETKWVMFSEGVRHLDQPLESMAKSGSAYVDALRMRARLRYKIARLPKLPAESTQSAADYLELALEDLNAGIAVAPEDDDLMQRRAWSLWYLDRPLEAISQMEEAAKVGTTSTPHGSLGGMYTELAEKEQEAGHVEEAKRFLYRAVTEYSLRASVAGSPEYDAVPDIADAFLRLGYLTESGTELMKVLGAEFQCKPLQDVPISDQAFANGVCAQAAITLGQVYFDATDDDSAEVMTKSHVQLSDVASATGHACIQLEVSQDLKELACLYRARSAFALGERDIACKQALALRHPDSSVVLEAQDFMAEWQCK